MCVYMCVYVEHIMVITSTLVTHLGETVYSCYRNTVVVYVQYMYIIKYVIHTCENGRCYDQNLITDAL